jgi:hypothetical protein
MIDSKQAATSLLRAFRAGPGKGATLASTLPVAFRVRWGTSRSRSSPSGWAAPEDKAFSTAACSAWLYVELNRATSGSGRASAIA